MKKLFILLFFFTSATSFAQSKLDLPGGLQIDLGFNQFIDAPLMLTSDGSEEVSLKFLESRAINIYYMYEIRLGHDKFTFHPGLGIGSQHYSFDGNLISSIRQSSLPSDTWLTIFKKPPSGTKKSKLAATYLDIPLEFRFRSNTGRKAFRVGLGGKIGYLVNSHGKRKYKDEFDDDNISVAKRKYHFNLKKLRYGVTARVGFRNIDAFVYYNISEVFNSDKLYTNAAIDEFGIDSFDGAKKVKPRMIMFGITLHGL